ncbi:MAG: PucR family transcriptional regulator [Mogibacterium sp.]|nr:PucR family transcriptional regulator [Mogibacterium sp.]
MGIAVRELLANDFFRDFEVIAGRKGIYKEIQGITILDAPDGFKWTKGKEMIMSSGYSMMNDPDCISRAFAEGTIQKASALLIKQGRYLEKIPEDLITLCNEYELPLILAPFSATWMEVASETNVAVMNRTIRKFQVPVVGSGQVTNQSYKEQRIRKILQAVESEMKFPALLYDIAEDKSYYSSSNFRRMTEYYGLTDRDYWDPSLPHTQATLCDYINMSRYRLINNEGGEGPRVSWVIIPIRVHGLTQAYFVVMEARELLDYYDEFSIRIAYLMLQSLYEQIRGARDAGYMGFENFIHFAMSCETGETGKVINQAGVQGISMSTMYDHAVIKVLNFSAGEKRAEILRAFAAVRCSRMGKLAILGDRELLLLIESAPGNQRTASEMKELVAEFVASVKEVIPGAEMKCGLCRESTTLRDIRKCVEKCRRVIEMGSVIRPDDDICDYEMLGPLAWLDVPEDELNGMLAKFRPLMSDERGRELLHTLKVYLVNNMNYSLTADLLFVHINTIRKRIDRIMEDEAFAGVDWNNTVERVKMILLLQFLEAGE